MNSYNFVLDYLVKNLSSNTTAFTSESTFIEQFIQNPLILEEIKNELLAVNANIDETESLGNAALAFRKIKNDPLVQKVEDSGQISPFKEALANYFSRDYSKNINLQKYIDAMKDNSIKSLIFCPNKQSEILNKLGKKENLKDEHYYIIKRDEKLSIEAYFANRERQRYTEDRLLIAITLGDKNFPAYEPSEEIIKNLSVVNETWPSPHARDSFYENQNKYRLGATIARYFPNLDWTDIELRQGDFSKKMWLFFLSILKKDTFMDNGIDLFKELGRKKLRRITKTYNAPEGEFRLEICNDYNKNNEPQYYEKPDMIFSYHRNQKIETTASLILKKIDFYRQNEDTLLNSRAF